MLFKINDKVMPTPARGVKEQRSQLVDSGRNALGQVVAQKINRRQFKYDSITWPHLSAAEWSSILKEIEKFEGTMTFWDALSQSFVTRRIYWGDASAEPFKIDPKTGRVLEYTNCQCNPIDMGY